VEVLVLSFWGDFRDFGEGEGNGRVYLSRLVLGDLVLGVLLAVLALAVGASGLWDVDLGGMLVHALGISCSCVYLLLWMLRLISVVDRAWQGFRDAENSSE